MLILTFGVDLVLVNPLQKHLTGTFKDVPPKFLAFLLSQVDIILGISIIRPTVFVSWCWAQIIFILPNNGPQRSSNGPVNFEVSMKICIILPLSEKMSWVLSCIPVSPSTQEFEAGRLPRVQH